MRHARLLVLAVLLVNSLTVTAGSLRKGYSAMVITDTFRNASETKVMKHKMEDRWEGTRLVVDLEVDRGNATVRLFDPTGKKRWEGSVRGTMEIEETFKGKPGEWKVELELKKATGEFEIKLVDF